ncbi:MAG: TetR/AcrR family transcriptional regulator [Myxococcales bacterium]|nr:TetR/AcrR family transcriptional regulator [Myxococcales bacterium]
MGRRKQVSDQELLDRAREVFSRDGTGVSSRQLAKEIGVSSAVLFQRFGSMDALVFAAMTPPEPDLPAILSHEGLSGKEQIEQLALGLLGYFRQLVRVLLPLAMHPGFNYETFRADNPDLPLERLQFALVEALEAKRQAGEIRCPDPGMVALNLIAQAHSLAVFEHMGVHQGTFDDAVVRAAAAVLWDGIAPFDGALPVDVGMGG